MANEIYNTSWWGTALDTARTAGTNPDFFGSQFKLLTSEQDNLITNGDFSNGTTDWTAVNANIYTSNNQLVVDDSQNVGTDSRASQIFTTKIGNKYKLTFDRISTTSTFWLAVGSSNLYYNIFRQQLGTSTGTYELEFVAISNSTIIGLITGGAGISIFDNVSVKLVRADEVEAKKCLADWIHTTALKDLNN
jgi:hypothetical protein